jgi:hypothetical protein
MAQIRGVVATNLGSSSTTQPTRIPLNVDEKIYEFEPNTNPFLLLLSKISKEPAGGSSEFKHLESTELAHTGKITDANVADDTEFTVDDASVFRIGDLITCPDVTSCDIMRIYNVDYENDKINVARGYADADTADTGPAIDGSSTNVVILKIASAFEEGSAWGEAVSVEPSFKTGYCQIFKDTIGITDSANNTVMYGGNQYARDRKNAGIRVSKQTERAFVYGKLGKKILNGKPIRTTAGILSLISTNTYDAGAVELDLDMWEYFLGLNSGVGSDGKVIFASKGICQQVSSFARDRIQTRSKETMFGISLTEYLSTLGKTYYIVNYEKVFDISPYTGYAMCLDLAYLKYKVFSNAKYVPIPKRGHSTEEELTQEVGLKVVQEKYHSLMTNVKV